MTKKRVRRTIALLFGFLLLIIIAVLVILRSAWFSDAVKEQAIAALQRLSGGRVEVADASFHWMDRSVDLAGVVLHGTEPPNGSPLLIADRIRVQLPFTLLWSRGGSFGSVEVTRPRIYFDDSRDPLNLPALANLRSVSRLHLRRLVVHDGAAHIHNMWTLPLNIDASGVELALSQRPRHTYGVLLRTDSLRLQSSYAHLSGSLNAEAEFDSNHLHFSRISLQDRQSNLTASGALDAGLHGSLNFQAHLDAASFEMPSPRTGSVDTSGTFEIGGDPTDWQLSGSASGQDFRFRGLPQPVTVRATYTMTAQLLRFSSLHADSPVGGFDGSANVDHWTRLSVSGSVRAVNIQRVVRHWSNSASWSGTAAGTVRVQTSLASFPVDSEIDVNLHISPGHAGVPLQGTVIASYFGRTDALRFDQLALASPGMQLTCSGTTSGALTMHLQASNVLDLDPLLLSVIGRDLRPFEGNLRNTQVQLDGTLSNAVLNGTVVLNGLTFASLHWNQVRASLIAGESDLKITSALLTANNVQASFAGSTKLRHWAFDPASAVFQAAGKLDAQAPDELFPVLRKFLIARSSGISGTFQLAGPVQQPTGVLSFKLDRAQLVGQPIAHATGTVSITPGRLTLSSGEAYSADAKSGRAKLALSASYAHPPATFRNGDLAVRLDTTAFPLSLNGSLPVAGSITVHSDALFDVQDLAFHLRSVSGTAGSQRLSVAGVPYTDASISAATEHDRVLAQAAASFEGEPIRADLQIDCAKPYLMQASVHAHNLSLQTVAQTAKIDASGWTGTLAGDAAINGPFLTPRYWSAHVNLSDLALHQEVAGTPLDLHNTRPAVLQIRDGTAHIDDLVLASREGNLSARGDLELTSPYSLHLTLAGSLGLQAFELFDPNVLSSGSATIDANLSGTLGRPEANGAVRIRNGSFYLKNIQTGVTGVDAQVQFNRNRALISSLTGQSGGGRVALDGFINYAAGRSVTYNLNAEAHGVRYRYANGISISGDSVLRLTGTTTNGLVSGDVSVARVVVSPDVDLGNVLASGAVAHEAGLPGRSLLPDLQLDLHIESSPTLQVSTSLARDVAASIDLRVRGTPVHPRVSGSISANQGDLRIFGAKYSINRCEVTFENANRIDPVVDLDLETQSRGVSVDITISGTLDKLSMNYRSDPPLQPKDILALLTVGKAPTFAPSATSLQGTTTDVSALQAGANTVLGQAVNPGSNRLSKLFGITNIKIDPLVEGMTNTPQSRLSVEQQISKNVTVTYVTNLAQTSEQIFRFEWALNPQYSVVAIRDDNGEFGIDFQFKKRFH